MSSPDKELRRNKSALAADKLFGRKNISPVRQRPSPLPKATFKSNLSPPRSASPAPPSKIQTNPSTARPIKLPEQPLPKLPHYFNFSQAQALIQKLIKNREHICSYLQLYDLLCANGAPMRCLVHNNFASLYCENQQKQLCVNCVYGNVQHKLHRVVPVKNVMTQIALDVQMMSKKIGKIAESIQELEVTVVQNLLDTQQEVGLCLKTLDHQFQRIQRAIHQKYAQCHAMILENFSEAKLKNEILLQEVKVLKDVYSTKIHHMPKGQEELSQLYQHMVLGVLVNQADKFDSKMLKKFNFQDVRNTILRDIVRMRELSQGSLTKLTKSSHNGGNVSVSHTSSLSKFA